MYFPHFLVGMFIALGIIAIWIYTATGSVWSAVAWTLISAIVVQVGYFLILLLLIFRRIPERDEANSSTRARNPPLHNDGIFF
jgi:exopolysaccharide production repressor protein